MSGYWWRTFGLVVMINLAAALPALVITAPFSGIADNSGDAVWRLRGDLRRVDHCAFRGALLHLPLLRPAGAPCAGGLLEAQP